MSLECKEIFDSLLEWPHRGAGSEDEMMAREQLVTHLVGEPAVDVVEEAFFAPTSYLPFFIMIAGGAGFAIWTASEMLYISLLLGFLFFVSHILFFDWRVSPLIWFSPKKLTANLVAKKGEGQRLFILMAHLDSAPASFAYRPDQVRNFSVSVYLSSSLIATGVLVPVFSIAGYDAPIWLLVLLTLSLCAQVGFAGFDFWKQGYTPGANDNLSGVAAATSTASRLWRRMPDDAEVRLVVTSAEEAGMLGAQHYWQQHKDEFKDRDVYVVNLDTVGNKNLRYIIKSGGFTPVLYTNKLTQTAAVVSSQNKQFSGVQPGTHKVGDFDSVWFQRGGLASVSIASYDDEGLMPHIHTIEDKPDYVDMEKVNLAAQFAEAIIRMVPLTSQTKSGARQ